MAGHVVYRGKMDKMRGGTCSLQRKNG